jgi:hypothetical protein
MISPPPSGAKPGAQPSNGPLGCAPAPLLTSCAPPLVAENRRGGVLVEVIGGGSPTSAEVTVPTASPRGEGADAGLPPLFMMPVGDALGEHPNMWSARLRVCPGCSRGAPDLNRGPLVPQEELSGTGQGRTDERKQAKSVRALGLRRTQPRQRRLAGPAASADDAPGFPSTGTARRSSSLGEAAAAAAP